MLLRQIKYFVTVVDCNSFTEAAEQLFISQSAIFSYFPAAAMRSFPYKTR